MAQKALSNIPTKVIERTIKDRNRRVPKLERKRKSILARISQLDEQIMLASGARSLL